MEPNPRPAPHRPEPLRDRAAVLAVIGAVATIAVQLGLDQTQVDVAVEIAVQVVEVAVLLGLLAATARSKVTPVADPRDNDGRPLRPNDAEQDHWPAPPNLG